MVASGSIARHPHLYLVLLFAIMMVHNFVIHDAGEKDVEGVVDDWVLDVVTRAPAASEKRLWHRYQDPESKQICGAMKAKLCSRAPKLTVPGFSSKGSGSRL